MKKMALSVLILSALLMSLTGCCCCCCSSGNDRSAQIVHQLRAGPTERETHQIAAQNVQQAQVSIQLGSGDLAIKPSSGVNLLEGEFIYNLTDLKPIIEYQVERDQGNLAVRQSDQIRWNQIAKEVRNEWNLELTPQIPLMLRVDVNAGQGQLELGGLRLLGLTMTIGSADVTVRFQQPNLAQLEQIYVRSDAARLTFENLGHAHLQEMVLDGGIGTYTFDLNGAWQQSAQLDIRCGVSHLTLSLPSDIGVRLCPADESVAQSLEKHLDQGLTRQDQCYINNLYHNTDITLNINLDVGVSDIEITLGVKK